MRTMNMCMCVCVCVRAWGRERERKSKEGRKFSLEKELLFFYEIIEEFKLESIILWKKEIIVQSDFHCVTTLAWNMERKIWLRQTNNLFLGKGFGFGGERNFREKTIPSSKPDHLQDRKNWFLQFFVPARKKLFLKIFILNEATIGLEFRHMSWKLNAGSM